MVTSLLLLACLSLLSEPALADLTCTKFSPRGSVGNTGVIEVEGEGHASFIQGIRATAGNPVVLDKNNPAGTTFHFQTCNSTSLGLHPLFINGDCDGPCHVEYYNVRVINPVSGHCLTSRQLANGFYNLYFRLCDGNPTTRAQIFRTEQLVYHLPPNESFGATSFYPYPWNNTSPWVIDSNNRTMLWSSSPDPVNYLYTTLVV